MNPVLTDKLATIGRYAAFVMLVVGLALAVAGCGGKSADVTLHGKITHKRVCEKNCTQADQNDNLAIWEVLFFVVIFNQNNSQVSSSSYMSQAQATQSEPATGKQFVYTKRGTYRIATGGNADNTTEEKAHDDMGAITVQVFGVPTLRAASRGVITLEELYSRHGFEFDENSFLDKIDEKMPA